MKTLKDVDSAARRFWQKVDKDGPVIRSELGACWLWTAANYARGYGHALLFGKDMGAHRASWILANGFLHPRIRICHHCDNPPCVRPDHLFPGTDQDNMNDKYRKGRGMGPVGALNGNAKLTDAIVIEIRRLVSVGVSLSRISSVLGIHYTNVLRAARGQSWKHVKNQEQSR